MSPVLEGGVILLYDGGVWMVGAQHPVADTQGPLVQGLRLPVAALVIITWLIASFGEQGIGLLLATLGIGSNWTYRRLLNHLRPLYPAQSAWRLSQLAPRITKSDTAGEVTFAGVGESANQRVEWALNVDTGRFQTSPMDLWRRDPQESNALGEARDKRNG